MRKTVAIVGRPNVGKSTLFNRLMGQKLALVDDQPGVTRDWREGDVKLLNLEFVLADTAGLEPAKGEGLSAQVQAQTAKALQRADVFLLVYDAREGLNPLDREAAKILRKSGKPVVLIANKVEGRAAAPGVAEGNRLGFGEPVEFSAEHGLGLDELYFALKPHLLPETEDDLETGEASEAAGGGIGTAARPARPIQVAIVGRPNAGKSTLINRLLGEERLVTSDVPGTTRDAIAVEWQWSGHAFRLVDTAGLRRKARVQDKLEKLSVSDTLRAIRFAEVAILVVDAQTPFETQDLQIADLIEREGRAMVVAVNKWDLLENRAGEFGRLSERLEELLPQWRGVPVIALSALSGHGVDRLMPLLLEQYGLWNKRVSTAALNRWLEEALHRHAPPAAKGRRIRIRYMTQAKARPPTFALFVSQPTELPEDYARYLTNSLRDTFGFKGVPLRLIMRAGKNPFADKD